MSAPPPNPQRWAAGVEYAGGAYCGWQFQGPVPSIQQELERVLGNVADHPVKAVAAGRTDAGVHAWQQVVHFDSGADREPHAWLMGCNSQLPSDIALRWVQRVPPEFDARRSATARRYRYVIDNRRARPGVMAGRAAWVVQRLDAERMDRAAQVLVGERDFSAFRGADCQSNTPMRCVHCVSVRRMNDQYVVLDIEANAFLHHMVRNIVGTLVPVGQGREPEDWVGRVLESRDRTRAGMTAPACGLYFVGPIYPDTFALPAVPDPAFPGSF